MNIANHGNSDYFLSPALFTCLRTSLLSFVLIITITLIFIGLNSPHAYAECSGICLYGISENPMDLPPRTTDDYPESTNDNMTSKIRLQKDQPKDEIEFNKPSENKKPGNFLIDNIKLSNLLSGAIAKNTLPGSDLITDDSGSRSFLASNQSNVTNTMMNSIFQASNKNDWHGRAMLYLWLAGIDGKLGTGGREVDVDVSFGDLWDNLNAGFQGHFELQKGKFGGGFSI